MMPVKPLKRLEKGPQRRNSGMGAGAWASSGTVNN